jgi:hypothetical protein
MTDDVTAKATGRSLHEKHAKPSQQGPAGETTDETTICIRRTLFDPPTRPGTVSASVHRRLDPCWSNLLDHPTVGCIRAPTEFQTKKLGETYIQYCTK